MKYFLRSLLIGLLCLAPLSTDATQRVAALISPQAIDVDLGFVQVGNVGNLSIMGAPSGASFSLLNNPGGHFSIVGTEIVAEPSTPSGQYSISVQATGTGFSVHRTFVLSFSGVSPPGVFSVRVNMSGMEDNGGVPSTAELSYFKTRGANGIRLPLSWAQMQTSPSGALTWGNINDNGPNVPYNTAISNVLARAAALGMDVLLDLHNFGQDPNGNKIGQPGAFTPADLANFWSRFVTFIRADPNYAAVRGWDTMNEWNNMDLSGNPSTPTTQALILNADTLAMNAIRATGDTKLIVQEWDHFSGAWDAVTNNISTLMDMVKTDPAGNSIVHVHGYLDHDCSGTGEVWATEIGQAGSCPSGINTNANVGQQRAAAVVALAGTKGVRLGIGETGWSNDYLGNPNAPGNDDYQDWSQAGANYLTFLQASNVEVYLWGNGPGFPNAPGYGYNFEPTQIAVPGSSPPTLGNPGNKDFTSAGLQATQMVTVEQFTGYAGAQPTAYRVDLPFNVTPYSPSGTPLPNFKIRYNGVIPSPITFTGHATLADGSDAGGSFSSTVMSAGNNGIVTFSYTPSGSHSSIAISFTNNRGLTDPPPVGMTSFQDLYVANNIAPSNVIALRRRYAASSRPALNLQCADNTAKDFYFNLRGDLPRQSIQDCQPSRSVCVNTVYNQVNQNDLVHTGGPCIILNLVNAAGYPELVLPANAQYQTSAATDGNTQQTIIARASDGNGGSVFLDMSNANGSGSFFPFRFSPSQQEINNNTSTVSLGVQTGVYHDYAATFIGGSSTGLTGYKDGTQVAQTTTVGFPAFVSASATVTNGYFVFFSPIQWTGSYTNFDIWPTAGSGSVISAFATDDATYYSTPLPDTLSSPTIFIAGASPFTMVTGKTAAPFQSITVTDTNVSPMDSVTITLTGTGGGTLTGTGLSGSGPYTLAADTPANITTKIRNLTYTPSGAAGTSETFTIVVANATAGTSTTNSATVATVTSISPAETAFAAPGGVFTPVNMKGVNISGGEVDYPETSPSGFDYAYPLNSEIDYYHSKAMGVLRVPLQQLRLQPRIYGPLDPVGRTDEYPSSTFGSTYPQTVQNNLLDLKRVVDRARSNGMYVALDLHMFGVILDPTNGIGRILGATEADNIWNDLIVRIATVFKNYDNIIIDPMNEPVHGVTAAGFITAVNNLMPAVAAVSPVSKIFWIEGGGNFSGAHDWVSSGVSTAWASLNAAPAGWTIYAEPHQYLDSDDSGNHSTVVAGKGATVLAAFTSWARTNSVHAILGEFGWNYSDSQPSGGVPSTEGSDLMSYMTTNSDVFSGWTFFVGGSCLFYQNASYFTASVPTGTCGSVPTGDAPQMSIMAANIVSSKVLDDDFIAGTYSPGPAASNDLADTRSTIQYVATGGAGDAVTSVAANTLAISNHSGLLNEPAATNLLLQNVDLTNAAWTASNTTVTANFAVAPDGTTTANRVTFNAGGAFLVQSGVGGLTVGNYYSFMFWARVNGAGQGFNNGAPNQFATRTGGSGGLDSTNAFADQAWELHVVPFKATLTTQFFGFGQSGLNSDLLIWRPMLVAGIQANRSITPSTALATAAAPVTRAANAITIQHTGIQSLRIYFVDGSQQDITGINPATQYTLPTTMNGTQIARIQGYSGTLPAQHPLQMIANRGSMPMSATAFGQAVQHVSYSKHTFGVTSSEVKVVYTGRLDNAPGEVPDPSCPCVFQGSIYIPSAPGTKQVRFTWNGGSSGNMAFNQQELFTDSLLPAAFGLTNFAAGTDFYLTTQRQMTSSTSPYPYYFSFNAGPVGGANGDGVTAGGLPFTDYTLAQGAGVNLNFALYLPQAIIGRSVGTPDISVVAFGDSLTESLVNNNTGDGGYNDVGGWFSRGMTGVANGGINGRIIPWSNTAIRASSSSAMITSFEGRSNLLPFSTHALSAHVHNTFGDPLEIERAKILWWIAQQGTSMVRHFEQVLAMPYSSTTDGYVTYGNQAVITDYSAFNALVIAAVGTIGSKGFPNAYYDHTAIRGVGGGNSNLWVTGTTSYQYANPDFTHPQSAGHDLITPGFISRTSTWN